MVQIKLNRIKNYKIFGAVIGKKIVNSMFSMATFKFYRKYNFILI